MTMALAAPARSGSKGYFRGTHRACPPEETWARIQPLLRAAGITRVGELTRLDRVGVPVFQAVRPGSRSHTVALGAGLTPMAARVGAAVASLERWHAERLDSPANWSALGAVRAGLGYNPYGLRLRTPHLLNDGMVLDWVPATVLLTGRPTMVPRALVEFDLTLREEWAPPVFVASPDGLAAGNTQAEAVLHGLYEVLARDSVAAARAAGTPTVVDPASVEGEDARRLLDRLVAAGLRPRILDVTGPTGVAAFEVVAMAPGAPAPVRGAACHLDREVALCRALAAAARARMAQATGTPEDVPVPGLGVPAESNDDDVAALATTAGRRDYTSVPSLSTASFAGDVAEVSDRVGRSGAGPVLVVELTREAVGLPVVRVVVPGLRHLGSA